MDNFGKVMKYDNEVKPFLLGPVLLKQKLEKIRQMFIKSLKNFDYERTTPLVVAHLGAAAVDVANSGVEEVVAPPRRGRPPKRRLSPRRPGKTPKVAKVSSHSALTFV